MSESEEKLFDGIVNMDDLSSPLDEKEVVEEVPVEDDDDDEIEFEEIIGEAAGVEVKKPKVWGTKIRNKIKLLNLRPAEHAYLVVTDKNKEVVVCDYTHNDYKVGDYVKTNFGTFWKVKGVIYLTKFQEVFEGYNIPQDGILKLTKAMGVNGNAMEYTILQLQESNYGEALTIRLWKKGSC